LGLQRRGRREGEDSNQFSGNLDLILLGCFVGVWKDERGDKEAENH